ncbi:MAG: lamin tail domain-containing protein, partial [Verrucomicrobiota bacterium]
MLWLVLLWGFLPRLRADSTVVFNEVHYHPADRESSFEWIELYNQMAVNMDLSGWRLSGGVDYVFAEGTVIPGAGFLVIAANPAALRELGVSQALGPFQGRLSNSGESLELRNNNQRVMDVLDYGTDGDWPVAPDGHGPSLAKARETESTGSPAHWRPSAQNGGTPGVRNFPTLVPGSLPVLVAASQAWEQRPAVAAASGIAWNQKDDGDPNWKSATAPFFGGNVATPSGAEAPIPSLFATGMSESRKALAPGSRDPHYTVVTSAHAVSPPPPAPALVISGHPAWLANDADSVWLGPVNPGTANVAAGTYRYRTQFDLSAFNPDSAKIQIRAAADNRITSVLLNGRSIGLALEGFQALGPAFTVGTGFIAGTNTLEFVWANDTTSPNPAGVRAQVQGTARSRFNPDSRLTPSATQAAWFRTRFVVPPAWVHARLKLRTVYDDGAAFYLNGREIHRGNLPSGILRPETPALVSRPGIPEAVEILIPPGTLSSGTNILAAEVHQAIDGLEDLWFEAELSVVDLPDPLQAGLRLNEVTATGPAFSVEVANTTGDTLPIEGFRILRTGGADGLYTFPAGTTLPPRGLLAVSATALGFRPALGDHLILSPPGGDAVVDALVIGPRPRARFPDGTGPWHFPEAPTPGQTNQVRLQREVVMNEIFYHPPEGTNAGPWIEVLNRSGSDIDLSGWAMTDGIRFRFPGGTLLKAGEYLVLAEDPEALRAENPGIRVLGPFTGRLSGSGERLVLSDADGNPADVVDYADAGRWPEAADGGGSSLELKDPWADNASPEAWAASDESSRSTWARHSYRAKAVSAPGPTLWNEWVMGLLDAGECLIDDLQVVESPGTATAVSLLKNGDFENGLTAWRCLGTHRLTRVIEDPDQPGNHVLHLVATGPTEHMHHHLETTLANNTAVVNGREYEVSFRARFLKGCPRLNTRLYFNRVAKTTELPRPTRHGTPGTPNGTRVAHLGPTFESLTHSPAVPAAGQPVTVTAIATAADGLAEARLHWSVNGGAWQSKAATWDDAGRLNATLPGSPAGAVVQFHLSATDTRGTTTWCPAAGPGSRALIGVADGRERLGSLHNLRVLMTPADRTLLHAETNVMSNEFLGATVIHDEQEIFYEVGVHLQGSQRGRLDAGRVGL